MRALNKKYWPFQTQLPKLWTAGAEEDQREIWCEENLEPHTWLAFGWAPRTYVFKKQQDFAWFTLRWK